MTRVIANEATVYLKLMMNVLPSREYSSDEISFEFDPVMTGRLKLPSVLINWLSNSSSSPSPTENKLKKKKLLGYKNYLTVVNKNRVKQNLMHKRNGDEIIQNIIFWNIP